MSLPAIRAIRQVFPHAHLAVLARPSVAGLYARETCIDRVIPYPAPKGLGARRELAGRLRAERFDGAILLQNAFDAALNWSACTRRPSPSACATRSTVRACSTGNTLGSQKTSQYSARLSSATRGNISWITRST